MLYPEHRDINQTIGILMRNKHFVRYGPNHSHFIGLEFVVMPPSHKARDPPFQKHCLGNLSTFPALAAFYFFIPHVFVGFTPRETL